MVTSDPKTQFFQQHPDGRMPPESAAAYLGIRRKTMTQWRWLGIGPPYTKLCGRIFYFREALDAWIAERSNLLNTHHARTRLANLRRQRQPKEQSTPDTATAGAHDKQ